MCGGDLTHRERPGRECGSRLADFNLICFATPSPPPYHPTYCACRMASLKAAEVEFGRLRALSRASSLTADDVFNPTVYAGAAAAVATAAAAIAADSTPSSFGAAHLSHGSVAHAQSTSSDSFASASSLATPPAPQPSPTPPAPSSDSLTETERAEMRRLVLTIQDLSETSDRIMAQNIALLADLEVAQRAVRELRAEKDALAVQLKRVLLSAQ